MAKPGGIRSCFTESPLVVLVNSNGFPRIELKPQRLQWNKDFIFFGIYRCFLKNGVFCQRLVWIVAIEALFFPYFTGNKVFSRSNNKQQNRRRKPWSQLLHCKMTRDSSTPWETLWQRSGRVIAVLSLVQLYDKHGTVKHTKCVWTFETSMR